MPVHVSLLLSLALSVPLNGCVGHIMPYSPKERPLPKGPWDRYSSSNEQEPSLWLPAGTGNYLFTDRRAFVEGDILTIRIVEEAKALRSTGTELEKKSDISAGASAFFGFLKALQQANPNYDQSKMIGLGMDNSFKGKGQTVRNDKLEATVTAVVRKILPNGNLFVEGQKAILVNEEEQHLYVSGLVRPEDVQRDNTVLSSRLADVQVEFTGRGLLTDRTKPGWFTRLLDWIWPF